MSNSPSISQEAVETMIRLGDALDATDDVQERNQIGFNKPDKMIWRLVRGEPEAMLVCLYKYQRQLKERFGEEECARVDWKLPVNVSAVMDVAKAKGYQTRAAAKAAAKAAEIAARPKPAAPEQVKAHIRITPVATGFQLDMIVSGGSRLERERFSPYLEATRKLRGAWNGSQWTVPVAANLERYKEELAAIGITIDELPKVDASILAYERADVRIEMLPDSRIGIYHPYSDKMNAAYHDAEETSGIIGFDWTRKCRVVGAEDGDDLREVMATIKKNYPEWTWASKFDIDAHLAQLDAVKAARRVVTAELLSRLKPGITPMPHQVEGYNYLTQLDGNVLVGDDMGLGKTFQVLLWAAQHGKRILVVCPVGVRRQWTEETAKFFIPGTFNCYEIDSKTTPHDFNLTPFNLVTINYEVLAKYTDAILQAGFDGLIVDESHRVKNPKAKITQTVTRLSGDFAHKILLSGTPIKNKKKEIFTQANIVRPGTFKNESEVTWMTTFAAKEAIKTFFFRRTKKVELPNLPEKLRSIIRIPGKGLPDRFRGMDIGDQSRLKSQLAIAKTPLTISYVNEILEGSDSKVIVFSDSDDAAQMIADAFGSQAVLHVGSTSKEKRELAKAVFMDENSEVRVFVATTGTCKEGVNLQIADKVVFNDLPWTPADLNQAEDRAHRLGQKNCVNVYWICAENNQFDERVVATLFRKMAIYKKVIDGKKPTKEEAAFLAAPIDFGKEPLMEVSA